MDIFENYKISDLFSFKKNASIFDGIYMILINH